MNTQSKSNAAYGVFMLVVAPLFVVPFVWLISLFLYSFASNSAGEYAYFDRLVSIERIVDDANWASFLWLFVAALAFAFGAFLVGQTSSKDSQWQSKEIFSISQEVGAIAVAFVFTAVVAFAWVGGAIIQFGGLGPLIALAANENTEARDVIVSASFPGGRLISSGFIGVAVYAAALIASSGAGMSRKQLYAVAFIVIVSLLYLGVIPILVSGRVNFFVAVIAAFVASTFGAGKMMPVRYILTSMILLSIVWTAKQYFTLSHVMEDASASEQGIEGLLFYVYNDVLNALNTLGNPAGGYTLGWYSLRFIFFFTFTDKIFLRAIYDAKVEVGGYVTAGEVPMLAAPIVDFGYLGLLLLVVFGAWSQYWYSKSQGSLQAASIYGMTFACLLLSVHANFMTSQEVAYSVILVMFISKAARKVPVKMRQ